MHHYPRWLQIGCKCLWLANDGEEHIVQVLRLHSSGAILRMEDGSAMSVPMGSVEEDLKPLVNMNSTCCTLGLHNYVDVASTTYNGDRSAVIVRDGQLCVVLAGDVVSVKTDGQLVEAFMQVKYLSANKTSGETTVTGRWLYTAYEALKDLHGRPSSSGGGTVLLLSDDEGTIPLQSINERVTAKSPALARDGLDDYVVKVCYRAFCARPCN
jgi:hypothetical protein